VVSIGIPDSTVVITHESTGIKVVRNGRCQHKNKAEALIELKRVNEFYRCGHNSIDIEHRRGQIGNGERSDKRRDISCKR
jgi:protein subunit release factor A